MSGPRLAACRRAAAAARRADHGAQAYRVARPRGQFGMFRDRGPLPVLLYVAAREGRLVWQDENSFAVLEPPLPAREPLLAGGLRLGALRAIDRHWELLCFGGPPALMVCV